MAICKIGLNPHQLIEWRRREATRHLERTYELFRQPITRTGLPCFYRQLLPFESKAPSKDTFDWDEFETNQGLIWILIFVDNRKHLSKCINYS